MTQKYKAFQGSALITALFIMTLIAIAATAMSLRLNTEIYRAHLIIQSDKLYLSSNLVTYWSISNLINKPINSAHNIDNSNVMLFPENLSNSYPEVRIKGRLIDLQSFYNLNNLTERKNAAGFSILLQTVAKLSKQEANAVTQAVVEWLIPYSPGRGENELTKYYLKQKPPYYASHLLFQNITEFRLIRGVDDKLYRKISPYLCVLPEITPININTASKTILKTLNQGLSDKELNKILTARGKEGFNTESLSLLLNDLKIPSNEVTLESQYFLSKGKLTSMDLHLLSNIILHKISSSIKKVQVEIVSQEFNVL